jgi:hypothetical protein
LQVEFCKLSFGMIYRSNKKQWSEGRRLHAERLKRERLKIDKMENR